MPPDFSFLPDKKKPDFSFLPDKASPPALPAVSAVAATPQVAPPTNYWDSSHLRGYGAGLVRGASGIVSGGPWGAASGGLGELLAQSIEDRPDYNWTQVAAQSALGAVPFGKAATIARAVGKGALMGVGSAAVTQQAEKGFHAPTKADLEGMAVAGGLGMAGGGIGHAIQSRWKPEVPSQTPLYDKIKSGEIKSGIQPGLLTGLDVRNNPQSYDILKSIPRVTNPNEGAGATKLAGILRGDLNPEDVIAAQVPGQPSRFQRYERAANDAIQKSDIDEAARLAASPSEKRWRNFVSESPAGSQLPAEPFSTRMGVTERTVDPTAVDLKPVGGKKGTITVTLPDGSTEKIGRAKSTGEMRPAIPADKSGPIYTTIPQSLYPRTAQSGLEALVPNRLKEPGVPVVPPKPKIENWKLEPVVTPKVNVPERVAGIVNTEAQNRRGTLGLSSETPYRGPDTISTTPVYSKEQLDRFAEARKPKLTVDPFQGTGNLKKDNPSVFERWGNKLSGAGALGRMETEDWAHLPQGKEAIDAYQKGDRSVPGFKEVQKLMDDLYAKEIAAGFKMPKKENYLRQFWKNPELEDVTGHAHAVPQNPKFTKESTHATYEAGRESGKTQRYENMNEIVGARIAEHKRALANKELYDYLVKTKQIAQHPGGTPITIREASNWNFHGEDSKNLSDFKDAVLQRGRYNKIAQGTGKLKNVYLLGGIPGTPLNIHGYAIARSEHAALGNKGIVDFARGVVNPANDERTLTRLRPLIKKALEHGYHEVTEGRSGADTDLEELLNKNVVGRGFNKLNEKAEHIFEDPLFKRRLPAAKALILEDNFNRLTKQGMSETDALKKAVQISSDFMGGGARPLTHRTTKNLQQAVFLAPDWAITRAGLAKRTAKALVGKEDPIYRQAFARTAGRRLAGAAVAAKIGYPQLSDSPSSSSEIPLGKAGGADKERARSLQLFGTEAEHFRLPEKIVRGAMQGDYFKPTLEVVNNRLSTPMKSVSNVLFNNDDFGRPIYGKDSFGRQIPAMKTVKGLLKEAGAPFSYQAFQAGIDYMEGTIGKEEFLAKALELPISYRSIAKENKFKK